MTYGSPKTLNGVFPYIKNVYGGRDPKSEVVEEFKSRYKLIGGSPLIRITQEQAEALEKELNKNPKGAFKFSVAAGMRFSKPFISEVVPKISKDADILVGIIMSPQYSPIIMSGYIKELESVVSSLRNKKIKLIIAEDWHLEPFFLQALAERVNEALLKFKSSIRKTVPVLFSAHSMPKRIIDKEPDYINHLRETASEVAKLVGLSKKQWMFCYQSAGHTPEEWLKPDFADIMPQLRKKGIKHVLIAPVQFLSDHLEILYDIGIAAKKQAEENGIQFARTESLNTSPLFIKALAQVVEKAIFS